MKRFGTKVDSTTGTVYEIRHLTEIILEGTNRRRVILKVIREMTTAPAVHLARRSSGMIKETSEMAKVDCSTRIHQANHHVERIHMSILHHVKIGWTPHEVTLGQILHDDGALALSHRDATIHGWDHRCIGIRGMNHRRPIRQDIVIIVPICHPGTILLNAEINDQTIRIVTMRPRREIVKVVDILALIRPCVEILTFILRNVDTHVTIP